MNSFRLAQSETKKSRAPSWLARSSPTQDPRRAWPRRPNSQLSEGRLLAKATLSQGGQLLAKLVGRPHEAHSVSMFLSVGRATELIRLPPKKRLSAAAPSCYFCKNTHTHTLGARKQSLVRAKEALFARPDQLSQAQKSGQRPESGGFN